MNEQIDTSQVVVEVLPEPFELNRTTQAKAGGLFPEFVLQRSLSKNYDFKIGVAGPDLRHCLQQIAVPFARNQLGDHSNDNIGACQAELASKRIAVRWHRESICIYGTADDRQSIFLETGLPQNSSDCFGYGNDLAKRPVAESGDQR